MSVTIKGEEFVLSTAKVLIWPRLKVLVVADLHLGKAQTFHRSGFWLPPEAHSEDLAKLNSLCLEHKISHVLFLGDFVHAKLGVTESLIHEFAHWKSQFKGRVTVVVGNHDRGTVRRWPEAWSFAEVIDEWRYGDFIFRHEPPTKVEIKKNRDLFFWCGHIHPKIKLKRGPERLRLPAFVITENIGYLPAYSSLAGGTEMKFSKTNKSKTSWQYFAITPDQVISMGHGISRFKNTDF